MHSVHLISADVPVVSLLCSFCLCGWRIWDHGEASPDFAVVDLQLEHVQEDRLEAGEEDLSLGFVEDVVVLVDRYRLADNVFVLTAEYYVA